MSLHISAYDRQCSHNHRCLTNHASAHHYHRNNTDHLPVSNSKNTDLCRQDMKIKTNAVNITSYYILFCRRVTVF